MSLSDVLLKITCIFIVKYLFLPKEHIFPKAALIMTESTYKIFNRNKMLIKAPFTRYPSGKSIDVCYYLGIISLLKAFSNFSLAMQIQKVDTSIYA